MKGKPVAIGAVVLGLIILVTAGIVCRRSLPELWYFCLGSVDSDGVPIWLRYHKFEQENFDFVRIRYDDAGPRRFGGWRTDYPDADVNLSKRVREVTSLKVSSEGKVMRLTDPELAEHPFLYISESGRLSFSEEEVSSLRGYLLDGGFLMVDDSWGKQEWQNFYTEIKRVFPEREPQELSLDHRIFHCVFDLKERPQVCSINAAWAGRDQGITWERPDAQEVHYKAIFDDRGRMMAIICHNTDLADGWERAGEDDFYYREFSRKRAFPMAINIIYYALTQ